MKMDPNSLKEFLNDGTKNLYTQQRTIFSYITMAIRTILIMIIIIIIIATITITAFHMAFINSSKFINFKGLQKLEIHLTRKLSLI